MSKRILFLDDESELVAVVPPFLERRGFSVDSTTDIHKALQLFADSEYDAVLLDIAMPPTDDMDESQLAYGRETGVEVARRMHKAKADVPLVALTVIRDEQIRVRMKEAGIRCIITKPTEPQQVVEALDHAIQRSR